MYERLRSLGASLLLLACLLPARPAFAQTTPDPRLTRLVPDGGVVAASAVFCGNGRKYRNGTTSGSVNVPNDCSPIGPDCPFIGVRAGLAVCNNNSDGIYPVTRAIERAEIRGWIVQTFNIDWLGRVENGAQFDEEATLDILLDTGWPTYATGATCDVVSPDSNPNPCALNDIHAIGDLLTPHNIIAMGRRSQSAPLSCGQYCGPSGCFPAQSCTQVSSLGALSPVPMNYQDKQNFFDGINNGYNDEDYNIFAQLGGWENHEQFGGTGSAIVHVEIDGWGPHRGCNVGDTINDQATVPQASCINSGGAYYNYLDTAPVGWTFETHSRDSGGAVIRWPFPMYDVVGGQFVPRYSVGQYVRIVGTLWKDGDHLPTRDLQTGPCQAGPSTFCSVRDQAHSCWDGDDDYTNHGGWVEMHPVDYMAVLSPDLTPDPRKLHTLAAYEICSKAGDTQTIDHTFSIGPPPGGKSWATGGTALMRVTEHLNEAFTNDTSLRPSWNASRWYGDGTFNTVRVQVTAADANPPAKFTAFYDAWWDCTPSCAQACAPGAPDGCGGQCASAQTTCTAPMVCSSGGVCACSCPAGQHCTATGCAVDFNCDACACGCGAGGDSCAPVPHCTVSQAGACAHQGLSCTCDCGGCGCE